MAKHRIEGNQPGALQLSSLRALALQPHLLPKVWPQVHARCQGAPATKAAPWASAAPRGSPRRAAAGARRAPEPAGLHVGRLRLWKAAAERTPAAASAPGSSPPQPPGHSCKGFPSPPASFLASFPSPLPWVLTALPEVLHPLYSLSAGSPLPLSTPRAMRELGSSPSHPPVPSLPRAGAFCMHSFASKSNEDARSKAVAP